MGNEENANASTPDSTPPEDAEKDPAPVDPQPPANSTPDDSASYDPKDASNRDVFLYAFGNIEGSMANQFFGVLNTVLVVVMHMNPLLTGLIGSIKTIWDSVTDPIMAHITDNTRSRWGRRIPYILLGGVTRILFLLAVVLFIPVSSYLTTNEVMEARRMTTDALTNSIKSQKVGLQARLEWPTANEAKHKKLTKAIQEQLEVLRTANEEANKARSIVEKEMLARRKLADESLVVLNQQSSILPPGSKKLEIYQGQWQNDENYAESYDKLYEQNTQARRNGIIAESLLLHVLHSHNNTVDSDDTAADAQNLANQALVKAGFTPVDIFVLEKKPPAPLVPKKSMFESIASGFDALTKAENREHRTLFYYVLICLLVFTTLTTIQSVPYYALGIELCPSYNGRTKVVMYRSITDKVAGLVTPFVPWFCFSLIFTTVLQGLFWVAMAAILIGIPSTVIMCMYIRERTHVQIAKKRKMGLFKAMYNTMSNKHFLKIFLLYNFVGISNGLFAQLTGFLNIYWVMGSPLSGAKLSAYVSMLAWALGLLMLPVINWGCKKFQKHNVLRFALAWMSIGVALKWWCYTPEHPEYQFILPFFFSIGIGTYYTVLPTMMADVTDVDEWRTGLRREGMFGAMMAFLGKFIGAIVPILSSAVLVLTGFDVTLENEQLPGTILKMRVLMSFVPAVLLTLGLLLLWKYPLTAERVAEIKRKIADRKRLNPEFRN